MSSLLSTSENKERSISFRSVILIMIYAGTIILNLLAASIDDRTARRYQLQNNSTTVTAVMESLEGDGNNNHAVSFNHHAKKNLSSFFLFRRPQARIRFIYGTPYLLLVVVRLF